MFFFISFLLSKVVLIISILFEIAQPTPILEIVGVGFGIASSLGKPFLKKSSFFTGLVKKVSSLKYTNCSASPEILCKFTSTAHDLNEGMFSLFINSCLLTMFNFGC